MKVRVTLELELEPKTQGIDEYGEDIRSVLISKYMNRFATSEVKDISVVKCSLAGRAASALGGKARARNLTKEQRSEIARQAAQARWGKK